MKPIFPALLSATTAAVIVLAAGLASAADVKTYDAASFKTAQAAGTPIVIDIAASWCPTCAAQKPIIQSLVNDPAYSRIVLFHVDFDSQKDVVRKFGAQMQSTLIAYNGSKETGRSVGDTKPDSIEALFSSTLGH
jgi:thiol-disulfide isomerase/thioredoxin